MRFTKHQVLINSLVKFHPAVFRTQCYCCDSIVWLETMYRVAVDKNNYYICRECAPNKSKAYDIMIPEKITAQDVLIRNAQRQITEAISKVELAESGLRRIIEQAVDPKADWNPNRDEFVAKTLVEAENTLRNINGKKELRQDSSS